MATAQRREAHRTTTPSVASRLMGRPAWREAGKGLALLPASVRRLGSGHGPAGAPRRGLAVRVGCGILLGLFAWTLALLAGQATVNGLLYPLVDAHDYQHSWGGPTLVGAWIVHALVAVPVVVAALGILRGLVAVDRVNGLAAYGSRRRWWPVPVSLVLAVLAVLLLNAWVHQVR
ncbi:hypothetical protein ACQB60_22100 [Actinomycetota bacterium Odt1-20B]